MEVYLKVVCFFKDPWRWLWLKRFVIYTSIFFVVTIIGYNILSNLDIIQTESENARYLISALIQSEAAIVSLVVTLTLIAIQMTANSYTPRVIDVIKKNPDMWFLLTIYIEAITIGFFSLKEINGSNDPFSVSLTIIWGIFSLGILFPYMIFTIELLRPDAVVNNLVGEIKSSNIYKRDVFGEWIGPDMMQPIFDVVHTSINRFDIPTTRIGLKAISDRILSLLSEVDEEDIQPILMLFFNHIQRSISIAIRNTDEGIINEVILALESFASSINQEKLIKVKSIIIPEIGKIGTLSVDHGLDYAAISAISSLELLSREILTGLREDIAENIIINIVVIGQHAIKREPINSELINSARLALMRIESYATKKGMGKLLENIEMYDKELKSAIKS